jgi:RNA polymerase sigma-70 factor (ECF subfamily)
MKPEYRAEDGPISETDEVLVERAKADLEAFGALYERYVDAIYRYVYHRTGSPPDAEDLTERVFMQALTHLPGYTYRGMPFSVWLYRIAHNCIANWYRDRARHGTVPMEAALLGDGSGGGIEQAEEATLVRRAVAKLSADRQQLLLLKFVEELPHAEIGQIMGRTEGAVKALLHRTLRTLKEELGEHRNGKGTAGHEID